MLTYRRTLCALVAAACGLLLLAHCGCVVQAEPGDSQILQVGSVVFQDATVVGSGQGAVADFWAAIDNLAEVAAAMSK